MSQTIVYGNPGDPVVSGHFGRPPRDQVIVKIADVWLYLVPEVAAAVRDQINAQLAIFDGEEASRG
jgi:hypothetical protein